MGVIRRDCPACRRVGKTWARLGDEGDEGIDDAETRDDAKEVGRKRASVRTSHHPLLLLPLGRRCDGARRFHFRFRRHFRPRRRWAWRRARWADSVRQSWAKTTPEADAVVVVAAAAVVAAVVGMIGSRRRPPLA